LGRRQPGNGLAFPVYALIGGKWTTFRAFAEQTTDQILARLGCPRLKSTRNMPFGGGRDYPRSQIDQLHWLADLQQQTKLPRERLETLFERYGTRAADIAAFITKEDDAPLENKADYSRREIAFLAQNEKVIHLADVLLRRTLLGMLGQLSADLVREIAAVVGETLSWSKKEIQTEVEQAFKILAEEHRVVFD
jgi:glycerol-3-phosphate dehydrogenase